MLTRIVIGLIVVCCGSVSSQFAYAAEGRIDGTVSEIYVETRDDPNRPGNKYYGGCMVKLSTAANTVDTTCTDDGFVTLACDGSIVTKSIAAQNFSAAQLAYATGDPVSVWVLGSQKINGYCYAAYVWNK